MTACPETTASEWLVFRAAQRRLHGAALPDELIVTWTCQRCGEEAVVIDHRVQRGVPYRDLAALLEAATRSAANQARRAERCALCDGQRTATQIDYHVSHSVAGCDLVVRWRPRGLRIGRPRLELLWWDAVLGYQRLAMLAEEEAAAIGRDAVLRALRLAWEGGGLRAALPLLEEAAATIAGDAVLMDFVPALYAAGHAALARAIVSARVAADASDAFAAYWLGHMIVQDVARGVWPLEALADAEFSLARAIALRGDFPEALLALAQAARLRGRNDQALARLATLLERHPEHVEGAYALGSLQLANDPTAARQTFARALSAAPRDPDCARGLALALSLLGRRDEAAAALATARAIAAADPRLDEIALLLARA